MAIIYVDRYGKLVTVQEKRPTNVPVRPVLGSSNSNARDISYDLFKNMPKPTPEEIDRIKRFLEATIADATRAREERGRGIIRFGNKVLIFLPPESSFKTPSITSRSELVKLLKAKLERYSRSQSIDRINLLNPKDYQRRVMFFDPNGRVTIVKPDRINPLSAKIK